MTKPKTISQKWCSTAKRLRHSVVRGYSVEESAKYS